MWEKFSFFGWSTKRPTVQPVQREVSVTLTNGDRRETIQRSPSGTKLVSSSSTKHGLDDDNSSEASTSLNFGFKGGSSPRRNSSFSFSREPLDLPTWSNVTSPGFTSRLVQQASGSSPLKEFNDSLSHSPFRKSPHRDLQLGELPFVSYSRRASSPVFPSPHRAPSLRSGVSSSVYNRDRRRNARQGQTFVRIAPIDPSMKANVSISRNSSSPPHGMGNNSAYPPRGSPRATNESYRSEGLGGIPQQELAMRFNRLWPSTPGGPVPGPGRPSSPTSPSNIMDALAVGRKRAREQDTYYPPNATPPSVSPPSKISVGIGDTPVRPQVSKRVKFLGGPEGHDRPMMVGYSGMGGGDNEHLSSESILEQMNQTEKRFLPDSTSTPYSMQKKNIRMSGSDDQPSALHSALRKRRSQSSIMSAVEDEARGEKSGRFCMCNECYAEAAGMTTSSQHQSLRKDESTSPMGSDEKSTNIGESRSKETCDKGVSTIEFDRGAYFREVFRKADKKKPAKDDDIDELMPYGKTVITKEMYERDKKKRIERYYRILNMKPPGGNIFDPCPGNTSTTPASTASSVAKTNDDTTDSKIPSAASSTPPTNGFNFGSPLPPPASTTGGFSFGRQTSPIAPTITTSACSTITSPSSTGSVFGSSTVPTMSTNATFGVGGSTSPLSTTVTPSPGLSTFGSSQAPGQISFSSRSDLLAKPKPVTATTAESILPTTTTAESILPTTTTAESILPTTTSTTGASGGFNFAPSSSSSTTSTTAASGGFNFAPSSSTTSTTGASGGFNFAPSSSSSSSVASTSAVTTTSTPSFGIGTSVKSPAVDTSDSGNSNANAAIPTFGGFGAPANSGASVVGASSTPAGSFGTAFGAATTRAPTTGFAFGGNPTPAQGTAPSAAFQFGQQATQGVPVASTSAATTTSTPSFGIGTSAKSPAAATSDSGNSNANAATAIPTFGGFGSPANSGTSLFGSVSAPAGSFGSAFGAATTRAPTTGFAFGGNATPAQGTAPSTPFQFGQQAAQGVPVANTNATTTTSTPSFGIGASAKSPAVDTSDSGNSNANAAIPAFGGFGSPANSGTSLFGSSSAPAGSFGTAFGAATTRAPTTGFAFGGNPTPAQGTAPSTAFQFGQQGVPAANTSAATTTSTPSFGIGASVKSPAAATSDSGNSNANAAIPTFGGFGSPANSGTSLFGSISAPAGSFGTAFGAATTRAPTTGFAFGGNPTPAQGTAPSTAFQFGQQGVPATTTSTPSFGIGASATSPGAATSDSGKNGTAPFTPFQFGQQAVQGVPGGFNFAASAPAPSPGGPPMFSMGSASTAPRRRDVRRRHQR